MEHKTPKISQAEGNLFPTDCGWIAQLDLTNTGYPKDIDNNTFLKEFSQKYCRRCTHLNANTKCPLARHVLFEGSEDFSNLALSVDKKHGRVYLRFDLSPYHLSRGARAAVETSSCYKQAPIKHTHKA